MSLHSSSSVNGEGFTPKDPLYKILDELRSLKLRKEKQERKEKGKKRVEEISQDEKDKTREEERRKILKELRKDQFISSSSLSSVIYIYLNDANANVVYSPLFNKAIC